MKPTRRRFLAGTGALAVATSLPGCPPPDEPATPTDPGPDPAPVRPPEPAPWEAPGTEDLTAFGWAVQVGDVLQDSALVSVRTTEATVDLVLAKAYGDGWVEDDRVEGLVPDGGTAQVELSGLDADTAYSVIATSADGSRRSEVCRFRSALAPGSVRQVVFAASSCMRAGDNPWDNLVHAAAEEPDFFLLLGDLIYARSEVLDDYRAEYAACLGHPAMRAVSRSTSLIATWDDHEVANNWTLEEGQGGFNEDAITLEQFEAATQAFHEAIPKRLRAGGEMWRSIQWGDVVEIFVLDCRSERDYDTRIVSDAQLTWITDALRASTATFKLVLSSVHLTDHSLAMAIVEQDDRWQGYPTQRDPLVAACAETPGVVVLTGDMHFGAVQRLDAPEGPGAQVPEVAVGPAGSEIFYFGELLNLIDPPPPQYELVVETWTSSVFRCDPSLGTVQVDFIDDAGEVVATTTLQVL